MSGESVNIRDPLVERLLGPGKPFELESETIGGHDHEVFKGAPRNLAGLYRKGMAFGDRIMVVQGDTSITYADGFARAAALAKELHARYGVTKGTTVAVITANRPEWIISTLAITTLGGIAALVNSRGAAEEMLRAIEKVGCTLAILDAERDDVISAATPDPVWPRIVIGEPKVALRQGDADFAELSAPQPGVDFAPVEMQPADGAIILFTSGTTGFPKGALLSHGALTHSVAVATFMGTLQDVRYEEESGETLPPDRRAMTTPAVILGPMFHLSGIMPILRALSLGTTIHIMGKWSADVAFDMIEHVGMTRLSFVPAMLFDMFRSPRATPEMLANVRYMVNGAAPLNLELVEQIKARMPNCQLANGYGQTEATAWTCGISGNIYLEHPAACGWAAPTTRVELRRDDGSVVTGTGEPGELWVRSPMLMNQYVGDPEATAETLKDGWLASGDIATVDANGIYTIVDRKKNMVISGGENIYCAEVERVVGDHPAVREVIAYGLPDVRLGERMAVTAVLEPGAEVVEDEIKAFSKQRLAIYKVPRDVFLVRDALPRTASGKVDRGKFLKALRERAEA
ncbi:AMP-binding protein [Novosphingobium sp. G106]|uniref:class I adenylate-forming enzyme family protein n=1 Tax=Novosphingobium sp. G106 TaxID=2849500 RepID=UPI001C2D5136|nr:AMP-binding protein [Novosphingobium sp. G106]MBV1687328.1 AMP-binding protein [Novosphingobium sp. G106]